MICVSAVSFFGFLVLIWEAVGLDLPGPDFPVEENASEGVPVQPVHFGDSFAFAQFSEE